MRGMTIKRKRERERTKQKLSDYFLNSRVDESLIWPASDKISTNKIDKIIITETQEELSCPKKLIEH